MGRENRGQGDVEATHVSRVLENGGPLPLPELRFSPLLSTARPSSTGEKLALYKLVRPVVS